MVWKQLMEGMMFNQVSLRSSMQAQSVDWLISYCPALEKRPEIAIMAFEGLAY